ncbi:hypothetical protein GGR55DRAFT_379240 [Xylaria sp. FL0064]|nr:hypothetical protein GGR55DRAFT_379240 [Xylaria sp. FL0064]
MSILRFTILPSLLTLYRSCILSQYWTCGTPQVQRDTASLNVKPRQASFCYASSCYSRVAKYACHDTIKSQIRDRMRMIPYTYASQNVWARR